MKEDPKTKLASLDREFEAADKMIHEIQQELRGLTSQLADTNPSRGVIKHRMIALTTELLAAHDLQANIIRRMANIDVKEDAAYDTGGS